MLAIDEPAEGKEVLTGMPGMLPGNELDPNVKRAKPALASRALQIFCRLLAYEAELDLARQSTPTWPNPTSTGLSAAICCTSGAVSPSSARGSPAPRASRLAPHSTNTSPVPEELNAEDATSPEIADR